MVEFKIKYGYGGMKEAMKLAMPVGFSQKASMLNIKEALHLKPC